MVHGLLLLIGIAAGGLGLLFLSNATVGVGLICAGCLLGIVARFVQAVDYHGAAMRAQGKRRDGTPERPAA